MSTFTKYLDETDKTWLVHWTATATAADDADTVIVDYSGMADSPNNLSLKYCRIFCDDADVIITLEWDQTTDSQILKLDMDAAGRAVWHTLDLWCCPGQGIEDPQGAGATGDILLTTSGISGSSQLDITLAGLKIFT
jgi:hypothetical protein